MGLPRCVVTRFVTAIVLSLAASASGVIPGTGDPRAFTNHDLRKEWLRFNERTLVEAYDEVGHKDPKWDEHARTLLRARAQVMANAAVPEMYRDPNPPKHDEMLAAGRAAIEAGCDDPLVGDMYNITLHELGLDDELGPRVKPVCDQMIASKYPSLRIAGTVRRTLERIDEKQEPQEHQRLSAKLYELRVATAKQQDLPMMERRIAYSTIIDDFLSWPRAKQLEFCEDLQGGDGDPWMTNLFSGVYHTKAAWDARGGGWANTVKQDGWKKMAEELAKARTCLVAAHEMLPRCPEAATHMITVVMGGNTGDGETERLWLDRAAEAQFDYWPAYDAFLYASLPRWSGSYEAMYGLGFECFETGRYDTHVPCILLTSLQRIRADSGGDWSFWKREAVFDALARMMNEQATHLDDPATRSAWLAELAGYAWQVGRYDVGRTTLDAIGGNGPAYGFERAGVIPLRTVSGTYTFTGPLAREALDAEAKIAAGQLDPGIDAYSKLIDATRPDDVTSAWLRGRRQEIVWQKQLAAGQWVSLISDHMDGWHTVQGTAESRDGQIIAGNSARLICGAKLGPKLEIQARVEVLDPEAGAIGVQHGAGLIICWTGEGNYHASIAKPQAKTVAWHQPDQRERDYGRKQLVRSTEYVAHLWNGHGDTLVDGKGFLSYRLLGNVGGDPDARIGFAAGNGATDTRYKVTEIRVRRIWKEPQHQ